MGFYQVIYKLFNRPVRAIWRVKTDGEQNVPETGCLLVSNHTSMTDVLVLEVATRRQIRFMAKAELFKIPLLKQLITALGAFPVRRGGADVTSIKNTVSLLNSGALIGIFPQGTRHPGKDPRETEVKGGIGMIAYHAKADVLPVFIDSDKLRTRAFRPCRVIIGKLIKYEDLGFGDSAHAKDYSRVANEIFAKVCELKYGSADTAAREVDNGG